MTLVLCMTKVAFELSYANLNSNIEKNGYVS